MVLLEERVDELKAIIASNDGHNAVDVRFARAVDELVSSVFDGIGEIRMMPARAIFDLFVIKVLYVGRRSNHAGVLDYLGEMLETFLFTRELFPEDEHGRAQRRYFSDLLDEERSAERFENRFDAYRKYGDAALFTSGVFPASLRPRRRSRPGMLGAMQAPTIDGAYYVQTGKTMYRMAASESAPAQDRRRDTLLKLAEHFELYVDALNEMSERYIMGCDMALIADKMLDSFNRYRGSREAPHLANARRYASLLNLDREPGRWKLDTGN